MTSSDAPSLTLENSPRLPINNQHLVFLQLAGSAPLDKSSFRRERCTKLAALCLVSKDWKVSLYWPFFSLSVSLSSPLSPCQNPTFLLLY